MKQLALWVLLIGAVTIAASLAMVHFEPASSAVQKFVRPGPLSPRHAYLADQCASCHEATVGVTVEKCTVCHANSERLLGRQPTAFHASIQECAVCHIEHQPTTNVRPLVLDHLELAKAGARTLARASRTDADSEATLKALEKWLGIRSLDQLNASSARETLNCAGCHDRRDPHSERFGSDCAQCHGLESWIISGYQHPSSRSKECVQCHKPPPSHFMMHFSMMSRAGVDECFQCHNTSGWKKDVGYYQHQ